MSSLPFADRWRSPIPSARWFRLLAGVCFAVLLVVLAGSVARTLTERSWMRVMGFGSVADTRMRWSVVLWVVALIASIGPIAGCLWWVRRLARSVYGSTRQFRAAISTPLSVAVGMAVAPLLGDRSHSFMLAVTGWREQMPGPATLGVDPGFYVFRLPVLEAVATWVVAECAACLVVCVVALVVSGLVFRSVRGVEAAAPAVLRVVLLPFVCLCAAVAMRLWLTRFDIATRTNGSLVGLFRLQYSTVIPMLSVLALGAVALGVAVVPTSRRGVVGHHGTFDLWDELLLARVGVCVWVIAALVGAVFIPAAAQSADPMPRAGEIDALIRHSSATVAGYDLDEVLLNARSAGTSSASRPGPVAVMSAAVAVRPTRAVDPWWPIQEEVSQPFGLASPQAEGNSGAGHVAPSSVGLSMRSVWMRAAVAVRYADVGLFTGEPTTVLVHHRSPVERAHAIAPFLRYASTPYLVDLDGERVWVLDAFTVANSFPGAQRFATGTDVDRSMYLNGAHLNYVRNSVKVVIDAETGRTTFYRTDIADPIARAWAKALPGLFRSAKQLGVDHPGIGARLRYPNDLLRLQAFALGSYHSRKPVDLVDPSTRWTVGNLATSPAGAGGMDIPYAFSGESAPLRSAVQMLEPPAPRSVERYVLVGRTDSVGVGHLRLDTVHGPRLADVRTGIEQNTEVVALRDRLAKTKRTLVVSDLIPVPSAKYGLLYVLAARSRDDRAVLRSEGVIVSGSEGVAVGADSTDAFGRYLALSGSSSAGPSVPVTIPSGDLAAALSGMRAALTENQRRLAESEAEVEALRRRVSVLESSGTTKPDITPSTAGPSSPSSIPPE